MAHRDIVSPEKRSEMMRRVRQRATPLERSVASIVSRLGYRYRLNHRSLPGSPDLSNQSRRWAIFVNGCFWHGHKNCVKTKSGAGSRVPRKNRRFWRTKIHDNRRRDASKCRALRGLGFRVIIVWECELRLADRLESRIRNVLGRDRA
jgi:DNA mismatch endonuclease (patch repair protein)